MASSPFPVIRSVLSPEALNDYLARQYNIGDNLTCHLLHRGINDIYLVTSRRGKFVFRVGIAGGRAAAQQINAEVALHQVLAQNGVSVPRPIPRRDGAFVNELEAPEGHRRAVLFAFVEGEVPPELTPEQGALAGETVARIHTIIDRQPQPFDRHTIDEKQLLDQPLALLAGFAPLAHRAGEIAQLHDVADTLRREIARLPKMPPVYGLCHGDLLTGNILWGDDGGLTVFDFDFCGYSWRVYDIATFLWGLLLDGAEVYGEDRTVHHAFVRGYQSVRPLDEVESDAIRTFIVLRHFWLLGSALRHLPALGIGWLTDVFFDRFIPFIESVIDDGPQVIRWRRDLSAKPPGAGRHPATALEASSKDAENRLPGEDFPRQ